MKKSIGLLAFLFHVCLAFAQVPQSFNYQGVARSTSNAILANKTIKVRLTIRHNWSMGTTLYSETRSVTTNAGGLFTIQVGSPGALSSTGNFKGIDWSRDSRWLQTEIDANNTNTFVNVGSVQMMSVPYALSANKSDSLKLPMNHTAGNANILFSISNTQGSAISGTGYNQGVGVRGTTDQNIGILGFANGSGVGVYGSSNNGVGGRFINQSNNTSSALEAEHKGVGTAVSAKSAAGTAVSAIGINQGVGVRATTDNNIGVLATSNNTGTAIYGTSSKGISGRFVNPAGNNTMAVQVQHQGTGHAIQASSVSGNAINATSTNGTAGNFSASSTGRALVTNGKIQFGGADMQAGEGKILVSDAMGNAKWERPVAFKISGLNQGNVSEGTYQNIPGGIETKVNFFSAEYNFDGGILSNSTFKAPVQGIYHFNVGLLFDAVTASAKVRLVRITATGESVVLAEFDNGIFTLKLPVNFSTEALLLQGDSVEVRVFANSELDIKLKNNPNSVNNWFLGRLTTRF